MSCTNVTQKHTFQCVTHDGGDPGHAEMGTLHHSPCRSVAGHESCKQYCKLLCYKRYTQCCPKTARCNFSSL